MGHESTMIFLDFLKNNPRFLEKFGKNASQACEGAGLKLNRGELEIWKRIFEKLISRDPATNEDKMKWISFRPLM